ncbi:hypothetical protein ACIBI3_02265 [Actinomadura luteofluorescens]|uniref:hypothetical protein n=1 Tax=Actinomadura luteofluorescens TaxID=46163 RepID=UPI0034738E9D
MTTLRPEDVPADLYDLALNALPGEPDEVISATTQDEIRHALAAVIPEIQRQERERIAAAILAEHAEREQRTPDGRPIAAPATPEHVRIRHERRRQAERDAEIARSDP